LRELGKMIRTLLSDEVWARIESVLPGKEGDPGRTASDNRWFGFVKLTVVGYLFG
jgi:hypothetical protein